MNDLSPSRLLRLPEVCHLIGLGRSQLYLLVSRGEFPTPAKIGRASVWSEQEVSDWIIQRLASREGAE